jgi:hypothetical protein
MVSLRRWMHCLSRSTIAKKGKPTVTLQRSKSENDLSALANASSIA